MNILNIALIFRYLCAKQQWPSPVIRWLNCVSAYFHSYCPQDISIDLDYSKFPFLFWGFVPDMVQYHGRLWCCRPWFFLFSYFIIFSSIYVCFVMIYRIIVMNISLFYYSFPIQIVLFWNITACSGTCHACYGNHFVFCSLVSVVPQGYCLFCVHIFEIFIIEISNI